ncbi:YebC/PmpR family DNA-binding transcriptional regulator [bacterium]|nr:YebC/PmpR family DNA-binding transcriptional regulator [bacterium]
MSGHSKWATTKHKKAIADSKRSNLFTKLAKIIMIAARDGADPNMNFKLRMAMDKARSLSMPKDNIERAVAKGSGTGESGPLEEITYEGYGPDGVAIIIEIITDNKNRSASEIRHTLSKYGGSLGASNSVLWQFDRKGVIYLKNTSINDEQELKIIDSGAEDIEKNGENIRLITAMEDLQIVQEKIKNVVEIDSAELEYIPQNTVKVKAEKMEKLFNALEENDDINNFYSNAEF